MKKIFSYLVLSGLSILLLIGCTTLKGQQNPSAATSEPQAKAIESHSFTNQVSYGGFILGCEYTKLRIEAFSLFKVVHFQVTRGGTLWVTADNRIQITTDNHNRIVEIYCIKQLSNHNVALELTIPVVDALNARYAPAELEHISTKRYFPNQAVYGHHQLWNLFGETNEQEFARGFATHQKYNPISVSASLPYHRIIHPVLHEITISLQQFTSGDCLVALTYRSHGYWEAIERQKEKNRTNFLLQ